MMTRRHLLKSAVLLPALLPLSAAFARAQDNGVAPANGEAAERGGVPGNAPWLQEIAQQLRDEFNLPAVWVGSNIQDRVEAAVVGVRKYGDPTPATLNDSLTVASISKVMIGLWIATLAEKGKITYDTRVLDVLPELEAACLPEHKDIVLGQLVTHTAALVRDPKTVTDNLKLEDYPAERIRISKDLLATPSPPEATIGRELYSNGALLIATAMAEKIAGEPYEVAAGRLYREVLGLKSWGIWPMTLPEDLSQPWPHTMKNDTPTPQPPHTLAHFFVQPGGSAHCNIGDLVRFGLIATNATQLSQSALTAADWATVMARVPGTDNVLLSFFNSDEKTAFSHTGSLGTTSSGLVVIPRWRACFAFHTNAHIPPESYNYMTDLLQDAFRKQRVQAAPPAPCRITLTGARVTDPDWRNAVVPRRNDDKVHLQVMFKIEGHTGDLKTVVKLGDQVRTDNRYLGLTPGEHQLRFSFDTPQATTAPISIAVDALDTAGNVAPQATTYESTLKIV